MSQLQQRDMDLHPSDTIFQIAGDMEPSAGID